MKKLLILGLLLVAIVTLAPASKNFSFFPQKPSETTLPGKVKVTNEESAVISAIDKALPSVVTIGILKTTRTNDSFQINPFNPFQPFQRIPGQEQTIDQNIGSGFIVSSDGLIVTNKHVVADETAGYKVLTNDGKTYEVQKISRDPLNDLAILKIDAKDLKPITLGDSKNLKLGQMVIAIGTPLGQFTNTVTSGIISGLKRGITAGSPYENYVERLDNVIQTDAAISPGNSGGPLINSSGEAIGVNTAVSGEGQNIGFAIPINVIKELLSNIDKSNGTIQRPYLGIRYQMVSRQGAVLNDLPEGAYIIEVIADSPAQKAGLKAEDIITDFDGHRIKGEDDKTIQKLLADKKIGDKIKVKVYRDNKSIDLTIALEASD